MPQLPDTTWRAPPHDPIQQLADNLWVVEGDVPGMQLRRLMVLVRLADGGLLIHNGICLDEPAMAQIESFGKPAWLVVCNAWHRIDAARFKARYPQLKVICPRDAKQRVEEVVPVDATYADTPAIGDPNTAGGVWFEHYAGRKQMEGATFVRSADGVTAVFGDSLFNLPHGKGAFWFIYGRILGATGGPRVTLIMRVVMAIFGFRAGYKNWLLQTAERQDLVRLVPGHGRVMTSDASGILQQVAATL